MKRGVFRFFRTLHAWGGVTLALLLLLSSVTGTLLVWKQEFVQLAIPEARTDFTPTPEALAGVAAAVESRFDNNDILLIQLPTAEFPLAKVTLAETRYAYVDTAGNVVDQWVQNERWEEWLYDLHHRLLLEDLGLTIVGLVALAMILLLIAGVVTFWPLRRGFRQGVLPDNGTRGQLLKTHRNLGIIEALPLLLTLITGATLAFPEKSDRLLVEPFRGEEYSMDFSENVDDISGGDSGDWQPAMRRALDTFPDGRIRSVQVPNAFNPYRVIGIRQSGELHPEGLSKVYIEAEGGWMDIRIDATTLPLAERVYNAGYPLHTGRFDSPLWKLLLTASGILVAMLSSLGLFCFLKGNRVL